MRNRFDRQLEQLNNELINMGSPVSYTHLTLPTQKRVWISMKRSMKKKERSKVFV